MEIKNLNFNYEPGSPILIENLNLIVEPGMFLTVLGENGSAKSTLIKLMLGLLEPTQGQIDCTFGTLGYVPQKKDKFNMRFPITVRELMQSHMAGRTTEDPLKYLEMVHLADEIDQLFGDLSGGQQQRVLIARAISAAPSLLILDEPLTGIDSQSRNLLRELLLNLNSQGMTIISIEHDIAFALHNSSHILTMKEKSIDLFTVGDYRKQISHEDLDNYLYHQEEHSHA